MPVLSTAAVITGWEIPRWEQWSCPLARVPNLTSFDLNFRLFLRDKSLP